MEFKFTIEQGRIYQINNTQSISYLAETMANEITDKKWLYKNNDAHKCLKEILQVTPSEWYLHECLYSASEPATFQYVVEIEAKLQAIFQQFKMKFVIPDVLADGDYIVRNTAIVFQEV